MRKNKETLAKKLEKSTSKFTEVQETMRATNTRRKANKTQVEKNEAELVDLRKVPGKNQGEILECEKKAEKLSKQKDDLAEELQKNYSLLEEQTKPLIERREQLENELIGLKKHVDDAKAELTVAESELKILKHDETTEARKYETMRTSYEESQNSLDEKRAKIEELHVRMPEIDEEIKSKTRQLEKLYKDEKEMRAKLMPLQAEVSCVSRQFIFVYAKLDFVAD